MYLAEFAAATLVSPTPPTTLPFRIKKIAGTASEMCRPTVNTTVDTAPHKTKIN